MGKVGQLLLGLGAVFCTVSMYWILQNADVSLQQPISKYKSTETQVHDSMSPRPGSHFHHMTSEVLDSEGSVWWSLNETTLDSRSIEYCRPLNHVVQGVEGDVSKSYTLLNVHVLIRHGERTSMYDLPNVKNPKISCQCAESKTPESATSKYIDWVTNLHLGIDNTYPSGDVCHSAKLTPRGLVQQIYNGKYLGKAYGALLFNSSREPSNVHNKLLNRIYVRSTDYSRTFQSALGFVHGLTSGLPEPNIPFKLVRESGATNLCSSNLAREPCYCKALENGNIAKLYPDENDTPASTQLDVHQMKAQLGQLLGIPKASVPWLGLSLEVFMGYACQGRPLPCVPATDLCVTKDLLHNIWAINEQTLGPKYIKEKEKLTSQLFVHPLLQEIAYRFLNITRKIPSPKFVLYSGHDKTITPLAIALGIYDGKWPSYATRLVIELYRQSYHYYMRLLYNGKDLTASLPFCDKLRDGLCPLGRFFKFVFSGFDVHGRKTYSDICNI